LFITVDITRGDITFSFIRILANLQTETRRRRTRRERNWSSWRNNEKSSPCPCWSPPTWRQTYTHFQRIDTATTSTRQTTACWTVGTKWTTCYGKLSCLIVSRSAREGKDIS